MAQLFDPIHNGDAAAWINTMWGSIPCTVLSANNQSYGSTTLSPNPPTVLIRVDKGNERYRAGDRYSVCALALVPR